MGTGNENVMEMKRRMGKGMEIGTQNWNEEFVWNRKWEWQIGKANRNGEFKQGMGTESWNREYEWRMGTGDWNGEYEWGSGLGTGKMNGKSKGGLGTGNGI